MACTSAEPQKKEDKSKANKGDSAQLISRIETAFAARKDNARHALAVLDSVKKISWQRKWYDVYGTAAMRTGTIYYDKGDYINCILNDEEVINRFSPLPSGPYRDWLLAATNVNLGATYSLVNDLDAAQNHYHRGIAALEKRKDSTNAATGYFNLAFVFIDMEEWETAYQYLKRSNELFYQSPYADGALQATGRLAAICCKLSRKNEASKYLEQCDSLIRLPVEDLGRSYYHNAYGEYHLLNDNRDLSLQAHRLAFFYASRWKDPYFIADEARAIGKLFLGQNMDSARFYLSMALDTARTYQYLPKIKTILNDWSDYYADRKQFDEAYAYRTYLQQFSDSLTKVQNHKRILLNNAKYQSEKKQQQINQLEQQQAIQALSIQQKSALNYIFLGSITALVAISFLGYFNFKNKQKLSQQTEQLQEQRIKELEQEKQLIAYDSLLKGQEEERSRLAKDLHDGLGGMLSGVKLSLAAMKGNVILSEENARLFSRALDQLDNSIGEMRRVAHNMMPEALVKLGLTQAIQDYCSDLQNPQLSIRCQFHNLKDRLSPTTEIVVYRIVQELLNNIVKHSRATEAMVQLMRHGSNLNITVEDNGDGFDPAHQQYHRGAGLANVKSRVDYLKGQMDIRSAKGEGTSIHIECTLDE